MSVRPAVRRRLLGATLSAALVTGMLAGLAGPAVSAPAPGPAAPAAPAAPGVPSTGEAGGLEIENSFVSSVGWVQPGEEYPSRIIVTNPTGSAVSGASVTVTAPRGTRFLAARSGTGTPTTTAGQITWDIGSVPAGTGDVPGKATLVIENRAASLTDEPTLVWRDLSSSAELTVGGADVTVPSHGPKVIPEDENYETARYGDRPFPVVPVQYRDRAYQGGNSGAELEDVINSPARPGSTFNLFQEMSLGQLYPEGTVPSADVTGADFDSYGPGFDFSQVEPGQTCTGATQTSGVPAPGTVGGPLYDQRVTEGVYNLPGNTEYYGSDANGSAIVGSVAGVGALQSIDSGCGPAGKLVYDAAAIADPEIDYSDYDTDKDGVVDFFMAVFAGCGGNGASQLSVAGCDYTDRPYDNVWPHSSSLEYYYTDPETGQPGFVTDDQLKDLEGRPLYYTSAGRDEMTTETTEWKVFVRVGPYNVNPETAIDKASVISHEYGHSLGLPDFYSTGSRETYGDWNLMATDKSQNMDAFSRQELGWVVPQVLEPGSSPRVDDWTDSKQDTDAITWQRPDGTPYTLSEGADGRVQNSEMYVAKLPGRKLLDPAKFDTGDKASKTHAWWSGSGNDFGCAPEGGHNFDLSIPALADLPADSTVELSLKSNWDIEWDYDYGYVLTTTDGGQTYASHESENGYTTSNTDPLSGNPNQNTCQTRYDNGLTGSSGSYAAGTEATDRKLGTSPDSVFLADSYDISDLAGEPNGALRFSYATDPGLARPGWFIDDVEVTVTEPGKAPRQVLVTDFETSGGPDDGRVFNGGCREDLTTARQCTKGWRYLEAGSASAQDHAYYLEMRDRSGFDNDGQGQVDRDPIGFEAGLYLSYTDEAHGYGNAGTDDPPAQSPLDSQPEPGSDSPDLDDAAYTAAAGDRSFTDAGEGHTDNYNDPAESQADSRHPDVETPWRFQYDCLGFDVLSMSGNGVGPATSDGDLTGDVQFAMGEGCGEFDYGYADPATPPAGNSAPTAAATAGPNPATAGQRVTFDATGSDDAQTPGDLDYSWDFGNGGTTKDATGARPTHTYNKAGSYPATVTVTDPEGLSDTAAVTVTVRARKQKNTAPHARSRITPARPRAGQKVTLAGGRTTDAQTRDSGLRFRWNLGNGGRRIDRTGRTVTLRFTKPGWRRVTLTVLDPSGRHDRVSRRVFVARRR